MPSVTARRQCPDLIFVKPRFEIYKAVSRQIREIFAEHTAIIEPLSLDEAYLDVTENIQGIPLARDIALWIREKIKAETGLNASASISYKQVPGQTRLRLPKAQRTVCDRSGHGFRLRGGTARQQIRPIGHVVPSDIAFGPVTAEEIDSFSTSDDATCRMRISSRSVRSLRAADVNTRLEILIAASTTAWSTWVG
jgi:hypothetical protein